MCNFQNARARCWCLPVVAAICAHAGLTHAARGEGGADSLREWSVKLEAEPHASLVDCRGVTLRHERKVELGEPWAIDDALRFTFTVDGRQLTARWEAADAEHQQQWEVVDLPAMLQFNRRAQPYALSVRLAPDGESVYVASATGAAVRINDSTCHIVDSDLDGRIGSAGDGLVVAGSRTVGPMAEPTEIWLPDRAVRLRRADDGGWRMSDVPMPEGAGSDYVRTWRHINHHRQMCGVLPLAHDASLTDGMAEHIAYMRTNRVRSHRQDPTRPGYSRKGAKAGGTSLIGFLKPSYRAAVDSQLTTLFHRGSMLSPDLTASAMLLDEGTFMFSSHRRLGGPLKREPLVYPAHGMTVQSDFNIAGEQPPPFKGRIIRNKRGTAISVRMTILYRVRKLPEPPEFEVHAVWPNGRRTQVRGELYYPGHVPGEETPNNFSANVAFIPYRFLKPGVRYKVRVKFRYPAAAPAGGYRWETFEHDWWFIAGASSRR